MDDAFVKSQNEASIRQVAGFKRSSPENKAITRETKETGTKPEKPETRKRPKLNKSLQDESGKAGSNAEKHDGLCVDDQGRKPELESPSGVKTRRHVGSDTSGSSRLHDSLHSPFFESRETRSKSRNQTAATTRLEGICSLLLKSHTLKFVCGRDDKKHASPLRAVEPIPKWSE